MKNLVCFTYAFDHAKSQNGLLKLATNGLLPKLVIAQPPKVLPPNPDSIGIAPKDHQSLAHWQRLLGLLQVTYLVADHDSPEAIECIKKHNCDFGVILGARILKKPTIDAVKNGILNMHPGLLPINRGVDNLKRAILMDFDPAVTFHLIDDKIDAGKMLFIERVPLYKTDTFHSIFLRHQKIELDGMIRVLNSPQIVHSEMPNCKYNEALGDRFDKEIKSKFKAWLRRRI